MEKQKERILWMDVLNILACFCVIMLHCNHGAKVYNGEISFHWLYSIGIYSLCYWSVPIFLMLSLCNTIEFRGGGRRFYKRRIERIGIPFMFWHMFYLLVYVFILKRTYTSEEFIYALITGQFNGNLWFFIPLFFMYMIIPFLKAITENVSRKTILYFLCIAFLLLSFLPCVFGIIGYKYIYLFNEEYPHGWGIYIAPMFAWLIKTENLTRRHRRWIYVAGIVMCILHYMIMLLKSMHDGEFYMDELNYQWPASIIIPIAVFVFFMNTDWNKIISKLHISKETIVKISSCSFGIYLIHNFVQIASGWFCHHVIDLKLNNGYFGYVFIYGISLIIILKMKHIPYLKKIVP